MGAIGGEVNTEKSINSVFRAMSKKAIRLSGRIWIKSTKIE